MVRTIIGLCGARMGGGGVQMGFSILVSNFHLIAGGSPKWTGAAGFTTTL